MSGRIGSRSKSSVETLPSLSSQLARLRLGSLDKT
jgi:hypothetical protein